MRVNPNQLDELLHPALEKESENNAKILTKGLPLVLAEQKDA